MQGQIDLCEFQASLVYKSRTAKATNRNPVSKNLKLKKKKKSIDKKRRSRGCSPRLSLTAMLLTQVLRQPSTKLSKQ